MNSLNKIIPSKTYLRIWFVLFLILFFADKIYLLIHYGFQYTDDDQTVMWLAAKDMLHGHFYQPCFYGQSYNPLVESILAAPLLAIRIPVYIALPLVSTILGILPFLLISVLCFKKYPLVSIFSLGLSASLPWFFSMLSMEPRGFITGIAIASVACALLLFGRQSGIRYFITGILSSVALTANPNCGLFLVPVLLYCWLQNFKIRQFYFFLIPGLLAGGLLQLYIYYFYKVHHHYMVHVMHGVVPSFALMAEAITHSDWYLKEISFIRSHAIIYTIALYVAISIFLFIKNRKSKAFVVAFALLIFLLSFGIPKVHDGGDRLNFPLCRMYLGLPFTFILFGIWIETELINTRIYKTIKILFPPALLILTVFMLSYKYKNIDRRFPDEVKYSNTVIIKPVKNIISTCGLLQKLAFEYHTGLVLSDGLTKAYMYAAPALGYPYETLYPPQERRRWRMNEENKETRSRFLFMPKDTAFIKYARAENIAVHQLNIHPSIYLVEAQNRHVTEIMRELKVDVDVFVQ